MDQPCPGREQSSDTRGEDYAQRLSRLAGPRWKQVLDVQRPYRWNVRRMDLGRTLDVGCGIGRNLIALPHGSLGVDHNPHSVAIARDRGLDAVTTEQFLLDPPGEQSFDSMLVAHVLEHMDEPTGAELLDGYLKYVGSGGKVVLICPQERGYATDATHVRFVDHLALQAHARQLGLRTLKTLSFPLPRFAGRFFAYNEFVLLAQKP